VQEDAEPLSYVIDRRWIPKLRREAADRLSIVECRGAKAEAGVQNCYLVEEVLLEAVRPSPSPRQTSS
jgi:hypothetical protein